MGIGLTYEGEREEKDEEGENLDMAGINWKLDYQIILKEYSGF